MSARISQRKLNVPTPEEVDFSPEVVASAAAVSIFGMILLGFPAELFNKTLQANYSRLRRVFPWIVPKPAGDRPLATQVIALVFSCSVAGLIGSFQKVHEWTLSAMVVTAVAIAFGFFVTVAVFEVAGAIAGARMGLPRRSFRSYQGALPIVALFVGVSALGRLQPAYVYGHLAGSRWREDDHPPPRGRALQIVVSCVALLAVAVACWWARAFVTSPFLTDLLAGVTLVGLNRLAFGLLPATFLDGQAVMSYSRLLWVLVFVPVLMVFLLLVILPVARQAPERVLGVSIVLFVLFAGLSLGLWAVFRKSARAEPATPVGALP
jgi:MFS family permease